MKRYCSIMTIVIQVLLLSACVPAVKEIWAVQPVTGHVTSADNSRPVSGARIYAMEAPDQVLAMTDEQGFFSIAGESRRSPVLLMAGSGHRTTTYRVSAPGFNDAFMQSVTILPPYHVQPVYTTVTLFSQSSYLPSPDCPLKSYVDVVV